MAAEVLTKQEATLAALELVKVGCYFSHQICGPGQHMIQVNDGRADVLALAVKVARARIERGTVSHPGDGRRG